MTAKSRVSTAAACAPVNAASWSVLIESNCVVLKAWIWVVERTAIWVGFK